MAKTLVSRAQGALKKAKINGKKAEFAGLYFKGLPAGELDNASDEQLVQRLVYGFEFINEKAPKTARFRISNPEYTKHSVLEISAKDKPFLIDSVWAELNRLGLTVHRSFHPAITTVRDKKGSIENMFEAGHGDAPAGHIREVFIHIEFDRVEDKSRLKEIENGIKQVLKTASQVVADFSAMTAKIEQVINEIPHMYDASDNKVQQGLGFLNWLLADNFILLGYRHYDVTYKASKTFMSVSKGQGLGIMADDNESSVITPTEISKLAPNMQFYISGAERGNTEFLTVTKALTKSRIHRAVDMDYVGVKQINKQGKVIGEHRFLGLFTSKAYTTSNRDIPIVADKISHVLDIEKNNHASNSYNFKALSNILETYPKDELFQISTNDLHRISCGILHLQERQQVRLFVRRSNHERLISAMVFLPRERMNSQMRNKIQDLLMDVYNGEDLEFQVDMGSFPLARLFFKIRTLPPEPPVVDDAKIEAQIDELSRPWAEGMLAKLKAEMPENMALKVHAKYKSAFSQGYQEHTKANDAVRDIKVVEGLLNSNETFQAHAFLAKNELWLKIFNQGSPVPLSAIMPALDKFGLNVIAEHPSPIKPKERDVVWLHEFVISLPQDISLSEESIKTLERAIKAAWFGEVESDTLDGLILTAGLATRQVGTLRALVAYLQQINRRYACDYVRATLLKHPNIAKQLSALFDARFSPELKKAERTKAQESIYKFIISELKNVSVLDEDIILRRMLHVVMATVRTNMWQRNKESDALALKIASCEIPNLVKPHPLYEIFVHHSRVEGIHLRGGSVARGGLRWSDRPADFRTEVLGLMKAQMTKNSVIIPVGSKGGFVLKTPPCDLQNMASCDRGALMQAVKVAYRTFISSLLSVTDNIIEGKPVHPKGMVCHDGYDPYFVVAADKGTATFSDIANEISLTADNWGAKDNKGFWLGDAFASGGKNGYDHKKMGITAKGAWECVKHHFRQMGKDIQTQEFTAIGIGDMAGDVFGNGMLLSTKTKLVAAFNHMHIFIDPNPDTKTSYAERERLFKEVKGWGDYDVKKISKGGGIFNRQDKEITLSPQIRELLGINEKTATPNEIMRAILMLDVELFWNGGIGTFVKASSESNMEVGDRANDDIRLNAKELRCKVIGEGGNLGLTQLARIEAAQNGVRVNTDAIDNSAGVASSDQEVNIKILLEQAIEMGKLSAKNRNKLLAEMTDNVARHVLRDNYLQAAAITLKELQGSEGTASAELLMMDLARSEKLDPAVEFLPNAEELQERNKRGEGFTRPELAVLLSYAKASIYDDLLNSSLPDDKVLEDVLFDYFPSQLHGKFKPVMKEHKLRREIIATVITNDIVNRQGISFVNRIGHETGASTAKIVQAYWVARKVFDAPKWWQQIEDLDNKVDPQVQNALFNKVKRLLENATIWLIRNRGNKLDMTQEISRLKLPLTDVQSTFTAHLTPSMANAFSQIEQGWKGKGLSSKQAKQFAPLSALASALDVVEATLETGQKIGDVLAIAFMVNEHFNFTKLHRAVRKVPAEDMWQRRAKNTMISELTQAQKHITTGVVKVKKGNVSCHNALDKFISINNESCNQALKLIAEIPQTAEVSHAMISVVLGAVKRVG